MQTKTNSQISGAGRNGEKEGYKEKPKQGYWDRVIEQRMGRGKMGNRFKGTVEEGNHGKSKKLENGRD